MKRKVYCLKCDARTSHELLTKVSFITKLREIVIRNWKCLTCETIKPIQHEKKNKNYTIYDG